MGVIRNARNEEISVIADFQVLMARETEGLQLDKGTILKGIESVFNDPNKGQYYVYLIDNELVGCLLTTPEWSEWRNGTVLWIQSVYVKEPFRGMGVFKELYEHIQAIVSQNSNLVGIRLYVEKENINAQKVYKKMGMNGDHYKLFEWLK